MCSLYIFIPIFSIVFFKGIRPRMNIFLKAYTIKSVRSVIAQMVFKFLACPVLEENKYKAAIGRFFLVYFHTRLLEQL